MSSADESRAALKLVTGSAVNVSLDLMRRLRGSPQVVRAALLDGIPEIIGYYSEGSAALAADFYETQREAAGAVGRFVPEIVVADRVVKTRRGIAWASQPLFDGSGDLVGGRLAEVVQLEVARPYRDTITTNRQNDPSAVGWRRVTSGGCKLCRMLADRGAIYKESTALFAAHTNCNCTAEPVFRGGETGPEASAMQYRASSRNRTPEQQTALRDFLNSNY
jgi:hypothetical protein